MKCRIDSLTFVSEIISMFHASGTVAMMACMLHTIFRAFVCNHFVSVFVMESICQRHILVLEALACHCENRLQTVTFWRIHFARAHGGRLVHFDRVFRIWNGVIWQGDWKKYNGIPFPVHCDLFTRSDSKELDFTSFVYENRESFSPVIMKVMSASGSIGKASGETAKNLSVLLNSMQLYFHKDSPRCGCDDDWMDQRKVLPVGHSPVGSHLASKLNRSPASIRAPQFVLVQLNNQTSIC